jgi:hypothetical protein
MDYSNLPLDWSRIVIDGDPGAGKTSLAKEIARELGAKRVSLDDYLPGNGNAYLLQLDYERVRRDILDGGSKVVVEGICILKVMAKIGIGYDFHIFMKRFNGFVGWELESYLNPKSSLPHSKTDKDAVLYYRECKPFDVCNLVLQRDVCDR